MRQITISGHRDSDRTVSAAVWIIGAFWILAGIVALIGVGGGLSRLAVALAIVTTEWWLIAELEDRFARNAAGSVAKAATVTYLRQVLTDQGDLKRTPAQASWRGTSAA